MSPGQLAFQHSSWWRQWVCVLGGGGGGDGGGGGESGWVWPLIMLIVLVMEARSHANHSLHYASKFRSRHGARMGRWLVVSLSICNWVHSQRHLSNTHTHMHTATCHTCVCMHSESSLESRAEPSRAESRPHFIMNSWLDLLAATFIPQMLHSPFSIICVVCYYFYYGQQLGSKQRVINVLNWSMNHHTVLTHCVLLLVFFLPVSLSCCHC